MFTGIITAVGAIAAIGDLRCRISCPQGWLAGSDVGDSIAVNGICLTITAKGRRHFDCDISAETRRCGAPLIEGARVNLEQALAVGDKLGGHIVTGHVDGTARLTKRTEHAGGGITLRLTAPPALAPLIAAKGSIALAGVSLTVNSVRNNTFTVHLIPHTLANTTLADYAEKSKINLETDILARHIARLTTPTAGRKL